MKWEKGVIEMLECQPPSYALTKEEQGIPIGKLQLMIKWRFEAYSYGTRLLIQHDAVTTNPIFNAFIKRTPEPVVDSIREQGINIIRVCERKARTVT